MLLAIVFFALAAALGAVVVGGLLLFVRKPDS